MKFVSLSVEAVWDKQNHQIMDAGFCIGYIHHYFAFQV